MEALLDIISVTPRENHILELIFENGEKRFFDIKPFLDKKPFIKPSIRHYFSRHLSNMGQ